MIYDGIIEKPSLDDIIIEHHGVKGMKWGVRHDPERSSRVGNHIRNKRLERKEKRAYIRERRAYHYNKYKMKHPILTSSRYSNIGWITAKKMARFNADKDYYVNKKGHSRTKASAMAVGKSLLRKSLGIVGAISIFSLVNYAMADENTRKLYKGTNQAIKNYAANKTVDMLKKFRNSRLAKQKMKEFAKHSIKIGSKPVIDVAYKML